MWLFNRLALWRAGARSLRLTVREPPPIDALDGIVVGGGDDIVPTLYGGEIDPAVRVDPERDALEMRLIEHALEHDLPVLGICRGAQMINVVLGGTLHQDIYEIYDQAPRMRTVLPLKRVTIRRGSRLADILRCHACRVNALHHQSIDRLGTGLQEVARDQHGIIQGIERNGFGFLVGVQWHPEFLILDRGQQGLYRTLVRAARSRRLQEH